MINIILSLFVQINVLVDTGSSNFAVAASPDFQLETFFNVSVYVDLCYYYRKR